jgi:hypothetical protein
MDEMKSASLALVVLAFTVPSSVLAAPAKVKVKSPGSWLKVDAHYLNYGAGPLQKAATHAQFSLIKDELADIVQFRKEPGADEGEGASHWDYFCEIRADKTRPTLIAYTCMISSYTGGAHGSHNMIGHVWTMWQNKPVRVKLKTMFEPSRLAAVEKLVREGYNGVRRKDFGGDGIRTEPIAITDLDNFTVSGKGVSFLFPHYVLASYAEGSFEIFVPWAKLAPTLTSLGRTVQKAST